MQKKAILGDTGLSRNSTNEIVAMLYSGYSMKEITDFMSHPFIKEIYDEAESNSINYYRKFDNSIYDSSKKSLQNIRE